MTAIRLNEPEVRGNSVHFEWSVEPATTLYKQTHFQLDFPNTVDASSVPSAIWLRVMMVCLGTQWALLRPCKVVAPRQLPAGEYEFWRRFLDAAVWTLESNRVGAKDQDFPARTARSVDVVGSGSPIEPMPKVEERGIVATAFSGGRDSLTQLGLLQELGEKPLLVTITSTRDGSEEFRTARRRAVISAIPVRRGVELVEVNTDLRGCWSIGDERAARYGIGVSEVSDTMLYFAVAWATAFARGCSDVFLASESEVQETVMQDGMILQHKHFMYSAITQAALRALASPTGIGHSGLTYPLRQFQVQRLLGTRYPDIRDLQYSCWSQRPGEDVCSRCRECFGIAINLMSDDIAPSEIGMDLDRLIPAQREWQAGGDPRFPRDAVGALASFQNDQHVVRYFHAHKADHLAKFFAGGSPGPDTIAAFEEIRANALLVKDPVEEPGYRAAYVELMPERLRAGMHTILSEHFKPEPLADHSGVFERTRTLGNWIAAPLSATTPHSSPAAAGRNELPRIALPAEPTASQLLEIADEIPGPEPTLARPNGKRALPVADTDLDGNELAYVTEAIESNWVSSAGPYVGRLEAEFARYCGTRFAVTTASGATALELMLRAGGVEAGDEVILPAFTMVATANAVHSIGAKVVFVDSDLSTWNMDLKRVVEAIGPKTRAIVAMHTYGHPVDMDALREIAYNNSIALFEDAAEAHGAKVRGRRVGSTADAAAFSFYGNKILTTGDGGIVTTDDPVIAEAARELRSHSFSGDRHFWHRRRASNFPMSNLQAALGIAQLERIDEFLDRRHRLARLYRDHLGQIPGVSLPPTEEGLESANWMFGIVLNQDFPCSRDELRQCLAVQAIETRSFFVPLHLQPAYLEEFAGSRHPSAELLGRNGLYLPSTLWLNEDDVARVASVVSNAANPVGSSAAPG